MCLALALVTTALIARHWIQPGGGVPVSFSLRWHLIAAFAFTIVQILLGTQVREVVDQLAPGACCNGRIEQAIGLPLAWHRAGAISVLTLVAIAFFRLRFSPRAGIAAPVLVSMLGLIVCAEYGAGVMLIWLGLPGWLQPAHLVMAALLHGMLLTLLLRSRLQTLPPAANLALA